ncbi:nicotinate-nucleotide diphosphorylase [Podospora aff. communis PSN243]|uniref:Nicotinate-nucleotide diphosphorylase n=1 Tax=Podospora aff. communis PSN243 TaxID=3040156 RepID=A0AAV9GAE2_9PEZI|nr:nicotinate-nucleotide diphosphorylase [Podospora aff. communis PSN243]
MGAIGKRPMIQYVSLSHRSLHWEQSLGAESSWQLVSPSRLAYSAYWGWEDAPLFPVSFEHREPKLEGHEPLRAEEQIEKFEMRSSPKLLRTTSPSPDGRVDPPELERTSHDQDSPASQTPPSTISTPQTESELDVKKAKILDGVVLCLKNNIKRVFALIRQCQRDIGVSSQQGQTLNSSPGTTTAASTAVQRGKKRKIGDRDLENDDDDDADRLGAKGPAQGKGEQIASAYACPYFKYNPAMYKSARNCPGLGWPSVHRVKEHLYRRHRQPKYRCGRCWQPFKDEASHLDHQRLPEPCPLKDMERVEGFDAAQERSLRSRKRANPELSEAGKWREVYIILFPHITYDEVPSPFYEYGELSISKDKGPLSSWERLNECEEYVLREVPPRLRNALSRELEADLIVVEESLRRKATACVKTLIADVFRELREAAPGTPAAMSMEKQPAQAESSAQNESLFNGFNFDFIDAFTMLGDEELRYDQGGLMDNILQQEGDPQPGAQVAVDKKLSDSGYGSNSPDGSFQVGDDSKIFDETEQ